MKNPLFLWGLAISTKHSPYLKYTISVLIMSIPLIVPPANRTIKIIIKMTKSKLVGRRTEYSRPLESKGDLIVPNRELTVEPAVPDSHSLTENADASALGVVARFKRAGHPPVSVWFDAEVLRAKAIAAGLVDQLIEDGKIVIGCAIGYTAGKVVVAPAA